MNLRRLSALVVKEHRQLWREPSNIAIGVVMPVVLLLIFGYGMSMDVRSIRLGIVQHEPSAMATDIISHFQNSRYFKVQLYSSTQEGELAIQQRRADACVFLPEDLPRHAQQGDFSVLIVTNATNASIARMYENYVQGVLATAAAEKSAGRFTGVQIQNRMWFNERNSSAYYMIPGVIVIIMSIIGCMLTALQMAKEYEHGNMESMFATPMTSGEILLAKMVNNYVLGLMGLCISLLFAVFLFHVPIRGNLLILLVGSSVFLLLQMALGLLISSATKNQFLACQIAMIVSFLPVFLLSGFLFEIPNMPKFLQVITYVIPARYYVSFLQSIFLVGTVWSNVLRNLAVMFGMMAGLLFLAKLKNPKTLTGGDS